MAARKSTPESFHTCDLPFASYLHSTRQLRFLGCQVVDNDGRVAFVFADPRGEGEQLQTQFEAGAECPAVSFYDSVRHLRRVMSRVQRSMEHEHECR